MSASGNVDWLDEFGCSDQRLVFRLVLAEVRRLRNINFRARALLAQATPVASAEAMSVLYEGGHPAPSKYQWNTDVLRPDVLRSAAKPAPKKAAPKKPAKKARGRK